MSSVSIYISWFGRRAVCIDLKSFYLLKIFLVIFDFYSKNTKYQPALFKQKEFYNLHLFNSVGYTGTKSDHI